MKGSLKKKIFNFNDFAFLALFLMKIFTIFKNRDEDLLIEKNFDMESTNLLKELDNKNIDYRIVDENILIKGKDKNDAIIKLSFKDDVKKNLINKKL